MNARHRGDSTEAGTALDAEGPLRRWARRRRDVAREERALTEARRDSAPGERAEIPDPADDASRPAGAAEKVLTDEDMPSLESLDESSDYSGFLSPGVSEGLRRRALRKLFTSAVFNVPDGLDDYDDDFTSFAALGDIVTADMRHQAEVEAERARQAEAGTGTAPGRRDPPERVDSDDVARPDDERSRVARESPGSDGASPEPTRIAGFEETHARATEPAFEDTHADVREASDSEREPASGLANAEGPNQDREPDSDPDRDPDPGPNPDPERT